MARKQSEITRPATLCVHGPNPEHSVGAPVAPSIELSTSFHMPPATGFSALSQGKRTDAIYTRWGNPTVWRLEQQLCALESAEDAVCFASGMAAISALFETSLSAEDHLIASNVCYGGTAELLHHQIARRGVDVSFVDTSDEAAIAEALRPTTKLIYVETPANPILRLSDLAACSKIAKSSGARLAVDSTFATPVATRPLDFGADYVVHSLTKYICGHGDTLGGVVLGRRRDLDQIRANALVHNGAVLSPYAAWLLNRSLHTLPIRMRQHELNAKEIANFLESHPRVEVVFYPGLRSHPQHDLARAQMDNFSGMIAFRARDPVDLAERFASEARVISYALSLGKTKTVAVYIRTEEIQRTSFNLSQSELAKYRAWAGDGLFRLSVGVEDPADLIDDLEQVLAGRC